MEIYTAQYRYSGDDRLDITAKSAVGSGKVLAPTWKMVNDYKAGTIDQWDYATKYFSLIIGRMMVYDDSNRVALWDIGENHKQITLVCFCPPGEFCHRILAARMLENLNYGKYMGEQTSF